MNVHNDKKYNALTVAVIHVRQPQLQVSMRATTKTGRAELDANDSMLQN